MAYLEKSRPIWSVTVGLAVVLLSVALSKSAIDTPKVLRFESERSASLVKKCLESPDAVRLLGKLSRVPVGNPLFTRRLNERSVLYLTTEGHTIVLHDAVSKTVVRVDAQDTLTQSEVRFLRGCVGPTAMW